MSRKSPNISSSTRTKSTAAARPISKNSDRLFMSSLSNRSLPFPDFRLSGSPTNNPNEEYNYLRPLPRTPTSLSLRHRHEPHPNRITEVPTIFIEPPILATETPDIGEEAAKRRASRNEFRFPIEELREMYKDLVHRYKIGAEQFNRLEKKRNKMTYHIDLLRKQVHDLEREQKVVDTEFERLGLAQKKDNQSQGTPPE